LVRQLHPEVAREGLPVDRALWFAIGIDGRLRGHWVGPNLLINYDTFRPQRWLELPEGSSEERRLRAEHRAAVREAVETHVPGMPIRARYALVGYRPVRLAL